jgi:hypothetical protein
MKRTLSNSSEKSLVVSKSYAVHYYTLTRLSHSFSPPQKLGSNLGPIAAKLGERPGTTTQNKAKRTNQIDFPSRLCKQGVAGSIPVTSTKLNSHPFNDLRSYFQPPIAASVIATTPWAPWTQEGFLANRR